MKMLAFDEYPIPDISQATHRKVTDLSQAPLTLSRNVVLASGFAEEEKVR